MSAIPEWPIRANISTDNLVKTQTCSARALALIKCRISLLNFDLHRVMHYNFAIDLNRISNKRGLNAPNFSHLTLVSLGQAAELAGYSKPTFMELLANYDVPVFNYSEEELEKDILNAQKHHI